MANKVVYRTCQKCGIKRCPHLRMENYKRSPLKCEACKKIYNPYK